MSITTSPTSAWCSASAMAITSKDTRWCFWKETFAAFRPSVQLSLAERRPCWMVFPGIAWIRTSPRMLRRKCAGYWRNTGSGRRIAESGRATTVWSGRRDVLGGFLEKFLQTRDPARLYQVAIERIPIRGQWYSILSYRVAFAPAEHYLQSISTDS